MPIGNQFWRRAAVLAVVVIMGCGGAGGGAGLKDVRSQLAVGNANGALLTLKSVLQSDESNAEARYLLGRTLVELGSANLALVEFRKAQQLKYNAEELTPALVQALLASGKDKTITDEFGATTLSDPEAQATLKSAVAMAHFRQKDVGRAEAALADALKVKPQFAPAKLVMARMKATTGQVAEATSLLDAILAADPKNSEAWLVLGALRRLGPDGAKAAAQAYAKAIEAKPSYLSAHLALIENSIGEGQLDAASGQLDALRKFHPNHPRTRQFAATLAAFRQDFPTAKTLLQPLLQEAPDDPKLLLLAGAVELRLGAYIKAETHLGRALQRAPDAPLVRKLLVQTYLKQGKADKALVTLQPLMATAAKDPAMLSLAAETQLRLGNFDRAEALFKTAAQVAPEDARFRTALALSRLSAADPERALQELGTIAASDKGNVADLAIISTHLNRRDYPKAIKAIDALEKKLPSDPLAPHLRGQAELAQNNLSGARQSFQKALQLDKSFHAAAMSLANLDVRENKLGDARTVLNEILKAEPRHVGALLLLADIQRQSGGSQDDVAAMIRKAQAANPADVSARMRLIELYRSQRAFKKSLDAAQEAIAANPDDPLLLDALGKSQALVGDDRQAMSTFRKLATLQPTSAIPHLRMAEVQVATRDRAGARQSLRRAIEVEPNLTTAQEGLVKMALEDKRPEEALAVARSLQQRRPKDSIGFFLEADVEASQKNWGAAIAAYRKGHALAPSFTAGAVKLYRALILSNKKSEADQFSATYISKNPNDLQFLYYLGDRALALDDFREAERLYLKILDIAPASGMALNNLAWMHIQQQKPDALKLAERAVAAAPENPAFLDTLALALAENSQIDKAIEMQKRALALKPEVPMLRLTYAKLLLRSGQQAVARTELETLAKLGTTFSSHAEVSRQLQLIKP